MATEQTHSKDANNAAVTTAAQWRATRSGEVLELSSGRRVMVVRPSLFTLVASGGLPNHLLGMAKDVFEGSVDVNDADFKFKDLAEMVDVLVCAALVEPKCVLGEPEEDEISIAWIEDSDKLEINAWIQKNNEQKEEPKAAETFREEPGDEDSVGRGGEEIRPEAQSDSGDS